MHKKRIRFTDGIFLNNNCFSLYAFKCHIHSYVLLTCKEILCSSSIKFSRHAIQDSPLLGATCIQDRKKMSRLQCYQNMQRFSCKEKGKYSTTRMYGQDFRLEENYNRQLYKIRHNMDK